MTDAVRHRDQGHVTEITLNRHQAGTAFDLDLVQTLHEALDTIDSDACEGVA